MNITRIVIITVLILIIVYCINRWFFTSNIVYDIMCKANETAQAGSLQPPTGLGAITTTNSNVIFNSTLDEDNTHNFMLSVWFYIDNWGTNNLSKYKNILFMAPNENIPSASDNFSLTGLSSKYCNSDSDSFTQYRNLNICLDKFENNLLIDIETVDEGNSCANDTVYTRYVLKNIPVQKWNNLTISVDTKTLDVYLDGKLRNSFIMHGIYKTSIATAVPKNNIYLGSLNTNVVGFDGFITRVRYQTNPINPQEAYNIYKEGINASLASSLFNKYGLKVSFLEYNKEKGSLII